MLHVAHCILPNKTMAAAFYMYTRLMVLLSSRAGKLYAWESTPRHTGLGADKVGHDLFNVKLRSPFQ